MTDLEGRTYLVVGGSSGIGLAITRKLVELGADVHVWSRSEPAEFGRLPVTHTVVDVGAELETVDLPEKLDGLVYCPGSIQLAQFKRIPADTFRQDFEINLMGAVKVLQYTEKVLRKDGGASVVLFSTVAVQTGMAFHASVAAAKGAVEGLTRSLAAEYSRQKIRFNCIAPSATDTPLAAQVIGSDKQREASAARHPLQRIGTAEDIASGAVYLLSSESDWVTGHVLPIDGGISALR